MDRYGPLGWVVDNPIDTLALDGNRKFGFDYTEFFRRCRDTSRRDVDVIACDANFD